MRVYLLQGVEGARGKGNVEAEGVEGTFNQSEGSAEEPDRGE